MSEKKGGIKAPKALSPLERYLAYLDDIFEVEPEFYESELASADSKGILSIVYRNIPEEGYITAFTYGLSLMEHPDWLEGTKPELCISVESDSLDWALIPGFWASELGGECSFSYGEILELEEEVSEDSAMDSFFLFAPSILEAEDYSDIDIGLPYRINFVSLYPIYASEIPIYKQIGIENFWKHAQYDNFSVKRPSINE